MDIYRDRRGRDLRGRRASNPRGTPCWLLGAESDGRRGGAIAALIEQAQEARLDDGRAPMRVLAVPNLADPGDNPDTVDAAAALTEFPQLSSVGTQIRRRKAVANAMAHGRAVAELTPRDAKACAKIAALVSYVFDRWKIANGNRKDRQAA